MAVGTVTARLDGIQVRVEGPVVTVVGQISRHVEETDGDTVMTHSVNVGLGPMTKAQFGQKTGLELRNELIAQAQADYPKLTGVTVT